MVSANMFLLSKKIHRFLVIIISVIGILMIGTGILLKYKPDFIDMGLVRLIHNNLSPYFVVVFLGMLITGLVMYIFPMLKNK